MSQTQHSLMTSAQAAEVLGVGVSTVNRWARDGSLPPATKVGGLRGPNLFKRAVVQRLAVSIDTDKAEAAS